MAVNIVKIKNLAGYYQQSDLRIKQLEMYIKTLEESKSSISGIYITSPISGSPIEITAGIDKEQINDNYLMHVLNGMYDEIATHEQNIKNIIQGIKKELQL